jgi:phage baseplate assembly protein W
MPGYSALIPFQKDPNDGFALLQTIKEVAAQNIKMVLYTEPGERVFDPQFGVGIKRYLFQPDVQEVRTQIRSRITDQIKKYLPYINIIDISLSSRTINGTNATMEQESNRLTIRIKYQISNFLDVQTLEI